MAKNLYRVPVKQWRRWSDRARNVFNEVYGFMIRNQGTMNHPKAVDALKPGEWKTVCWNSAWIAADAVDDCIPDEIVTVKAA